MSIVDGGNQLVRASDHLPDGIEVVERDQQQILWGSTQHHLHTTHSTNNAILGQHTGLESGTLPIPGNVFLMCSTKHPSPESSYAWHLEPNHPMYM